MGIALLSASAAAGCFSRCFVHPMDTLRSRLMVSTTSQKTLMGAFREVISSDGARGLYRGFGISIVMQAPAVATYLSTYDEAKERITRATSLSPTSPAVHLVSGLVAETVSAVFWVPMEVIKQRAQVRAGAMSAASSTIIARDLMINEGPKALFKGYGLTLGVFGPYAMIYFAAYEKFKLTASNTSKITPISVDDLPTSTVAVCASAAGALAGACTTPLDVIKTRMQTQGDAVALTTQSAADGGKVTYRSTWHAARVIAAEEGLRGFFKGLSARVLWIMPGTAITFSTFEFLKKYFNLKP